MLYNPPTGAATVNDGYVGKNVAAGKQGSKVRPLAVEAPQREVVNAELAAGLSPTNSDFTQLAQAMSIGLWLGTFGGTPNGLTAALPTLATTSDGVTTFMIPSLQVGMRFHGLIGPAANTGAATLAIAGFAQNAGVKTASKADGVSAFAAGDLKPGTIATWVWDGAVFRLTGLVASDIFARIQASTRTNLTDNLTVFVRPDGNDGNNGLSDTAAGAFKTPRGAFDAITRQYNLGGYSVSIQLSKTYAPGVVTAYPGLSAPNVGVFGNITLQGDPANPQNYVLTPVLLGDGTSYCVASFIDTLFVQGLTLDASSVTVGGAVRANGGGDLCFSSVTIKYTGSSSNIRLVFADPLSTVRRGGPLTVTGGGTVAAIISVSGGADLGCTLTTPQPFVINGMTFGAFYEITTGRASIQKTTFSGTGNTGLRWTNTNGYLDTAGADVATIPGTANGTSAYGGQVPGAPLPSYTPAISGTSGSGFSAVLDSASFKQDGKLLFVRVVAQINYTTAPSGVAIALPNGVTPNRSQCLSALNLSSGVSLAAQTSNTQLYVTVTRYDGSSPVSGSGQYIVVEGWIEVQ